MANKRALIVGINYPGTSSELRGCVNDANNVELLLKTQYGFTDVRKLLDAEATTTQIKGSLDWLVDGAKPGDVLVFHYSGHGSQTYDIGGDEPDKFDEIICPIDIDWIHNVITDDYMKSVFDRVPTGVNLTVVLDSCNSGTGIDQNETIGAVGTQTPLAAAAAKWAEASGRYLPPPVEIQALIHEHCCQPKERSVQSRDVNSSALLISGCQADQTSADAYINGIWQGAATHAMTTALRVDPKLSYRSLITDMNDFMITQQYTQRPQLDGNRLLYDTVFLQPFTIVAGSEPVAPVVVQPQEKDRTMLWVGAASIAFVLFLMFG